MAVGHFGEWALKKIKEQKKESNTPGKVTTTFAPSVYQSDFKPNTYVFSGAEKVGTGGQGTRNLLTSTLQQAQRQARLTGRGLTQDVTKGLTSSYFGGATERVASGKALALQKDVAEAGLTSAERIKSGELNLAMKQLESAEKMYQAGLISNEQLQRERMKVDKEIAKIQGKSQEKAMEKQGGLFGGGGILGLGF